MDAVTEPSEHLETAYKYAWDWFSYHAAQRLTTFRFFLVMIGVVIVGYFKCVELTWPRFGFVMGLFGAFIALAFWILEIRNEELVRCGRAALDRLEPLMQSTIRNDDEKRIYLEKSLGPFSRVLAWILPSECFAKLVKHRFWLRLIYAITIFGFVGAAIYAWRGFKWLW